MTRLEKRQFVEAFSKECAGYSCMLVVRQTKLDAKTVAQLRRQAHQSGLVFKVVKNTLAKKALSDSAVMDAFVGSTAVVLGHDPVSAAKFVGDFSKKREDCFHALAGVSEGGVLSLDDIHAMAALPSLDQLRAQFVFLLGEPCRRFVRVLSEKSKK